MFARFLLHVWAYPPIRLVGLLLSESHLGEPENWHWPAAQRLLIVELSELFLGGNQGFNSLICVGLGELLNLSGLHILYL